MDSISQSATAMDPISQSATAMDPISVSDVAMDAVWESQIARDIVLEVSMAAGKFVASLADLYGPDYADIDDVATDQDAMDAVSTSQTAMDAVSVSTVAMEAVAASALAMDAVIASDDIALPTIVEEEIAMDAVSTSETAMDAVSTSETAMDAVSSSDLAMDAVDAAEVARNAVTAIEMASAKFLAGRATLDPSLYTTLDSVGSDLPTDDQAAMDAVSTSQTAMDAVSASIVARSALLGSTYVVGSVWERDMASEKIWKSSAIDVDGNSQTLPFTVGSGTTETEFELIGDPEQSAGQLYHINSLNSFEDYSEGEVTMRFESDVAPYDTMLLETERFNDNGSGYLDIVVRANGSELLRVESGHSRTERSLDISSYGGGTDIDIVIDLTRADEGNIYIAKPRFE